MLNLILCAHFLPFSSIPAAAEDIILNKREVYVKKGFDASWTRQKPHPSDPSWVRVPPRDKNWRIRIIDLPFPKSPVYECDFFRERPPETYTILATFSISSISDLENRFSGFYTDMIGENWAVYLNGRLIQNEIHLTRDNRIAEYRSYRHVLVYLNPRLMRAGENILAFQIIGDPGSTDTGFSMNTPLRIGNYGDLSRKKVKVIPMMLVVAYLIAGLYHLVLFIFRRSERHNLFFGLFSIMLFIYFICRTSNIYFLIPDSKWAYMLEFCSLFALFPLMLNYMDLILFGRMREFVKGYGIFCAILIAALFVVPYGTRLDILRIWQYTAILPVVYFIFFQIGTAFFTAVREYRAAMKGVPAIGPAKAYAHCFANTVAGNLMIGALITVGCAVFDVLDALYFSTGILITNYGFMFFVFGVTFVLSNRFVYLYSEIDGLTVELRNKSKDLKETRVKYGISQEKYRLLVEGSSDIIFSLDEKFRFVTANRRMRDLLRLDDAAFGSKTLLDVIHETDERSVTMQFVQNKLEQFVADKKPVSMKIDFRTPYGIEPTSLQVRLEYIHIEGRNEIFGRGTGVSEDMLSQYIEDESQHYRIANLLLVADDLSFRITRNMEKFVGRRDLNLIRMAVREILINAIEHGNLGITFEEKSREMDGGDYFAFFKERQNDQKFSGRTVDVKYRVDSEKVEYIISDQGAGFDFSRFMGDDMDANEALLPHGRGISLTKSVFDEIRYNEKGNSVTLVKRFKRQS